MTHDKYLSAERYTQRLRHVLAGGSGAVTAVLKTGAALSACQGNRGRLACQDSRAHVYVEDVLIILLVVLLLLGYGIIGIIGALGVGP